jgi:hypothetical protein
MITWQEVEKHWTDYKPQIHNKWLKIPDAELNRIKGKKEQLVHAIEESYHVPHSDATKQLDSFLKTAKPFKH